MAVKWFLSTGSAFSRASKKIMLAMLEVRSEILFLFFSLNLSKVMMQVSQSWL
jgi:hypothetical protein